MHKQDWRDAEIDPGGIEFNLPVSKWFELFNRTGFTVEDYLEPRPSADKSGVRFMQAAEWARKWPSEQVWKLRKPGEEDELKDRLVDGELHVGTMEAAIQRAQQLVRQYVPEETQLSEELMKERRRVANTEM